MMQIHPVKRYRQPSYPTQDILRAHPELLRLMPKRWQSSSVVLTALGMAAMLLSSCRGTDEEKLWTNGYGGGPEGIVARNWKPLSRMSEAEACRIIEDEAVHFGVRFKHNSVPLNATKQIVEFEHYDWDATLDGYDSIHNIGYEYVSTNDGNVWMPGYTKLNFDTPAINSQTVIAVFNGEIAWQPEKYGTRHIWGDMYEHYLPKDKVVEYTKTDKHPTEIELRLKVRDFMEWLKSQGII
jgi:hypothetical protein